MKQFNVPPTWNRMGFCEKAAYLCASSQAKDYSHACSILAKHRKRPPNAIPQPTIAIRLPYAEN